MAKKKGRSKSKKEHKTHTIPAINLPRITAPKDVTELNKILVENFVSLQKVLTNLAGKFDSLADNISKLLQLFEISAKTFAEKQPTFDFEKDKEFLDKLDKLLDQNKTIAKGLTLMEEKIREKVYGPQFPPSQPRAQSFAPPQQEFMQQAPRQSFEQGRYAPSMMSGAPSSTASIIPTGDEKWKKLPKQ